MARPPGPRLPSAVQTAALAAQPLAFLEGCRRRYGDVFTLRVAPFGTLTYVADPVICKEVFTGDVAVFRAGEANAFLEPTLGRASVLLLDGDEHLQTRKLMLPPFHGEAVRRYAEVIEDIAARELAAWPVGAPFAVRPSMQRITLEVILRAVFGIDDPERLEALRGLLTAMTAQNPAFLWFEWMRVDLGPRSPYGRFLALRDRVDAILFDEIARRRRATGTGERVDVLSLLLAARFPDGSGLSDGALRDQLMTLLLAGHETTATGLAWACERLVRHPRVIERARADDAYLDATVKEVLRSRPVVIDVARVVSEPAAVGGFDLEPGTMAVPAIAVVQRGVDAWPDPDAFRPERFLEGSLPPYAWIPFGGGTRRCLGAAFASLEMKVVLKTVLNRARVTAPPGRRAEAQRLRHVTLVPARGGEIVVDQRVLAPAQRAGGLAHADEVGGDAADNGVVGHVLGDDGAGAQDAVVADRDPA